MSWRNSFKISFFLVFSLALSGILFGQRVIDLDKVYGDMQVWGYNVLGLSGFAVSHGDINGDGYQDILIGAIWADVGDQVAAGHVYVVFGSSNPPATVDLNSQPADITVYGASGQNWTGRAVSSGDINGDGYDDVIFGAPNAQDPVSSGRGRVHVLFGSSSPPSTINLGTESTDINIWGDWGDYAGWALASGDVNKDDYDDIIIGSSNNVAYVIFGGDFTPPVNIVLHTQPADITVHGTNWEDLWSESLGCAVASGDVNHDGYDDFILGAKEARPFDRLRAGAVYVIFGDSFPSPPYTINLNSQQADITVWGEASDRPITGKSVSSGDVNGDGYSDVIIGAYLADTPNWINAGKTYVIFGGSLASPPYTIDLQSQSADVTVYGGYYMGWSGSAVASGNVNGDSYDDVLIFAPYDGLPEGNEPGASYVVFGRSFSPPLVIDLGSQPADITIWGDHCWDFAGDTVASGDVNGDGYDDVISGSIWADTPGGEDAGKTYVISGGGAFITAHGLGGKSWIKQFSLLGRDWGSFKAFGAANSQGEVHLAMGEIDGDGHDEIAAGQGEGGKSWVKFFEVDGSLISTFKAFGAANTNGELHLTIGNFDAETSDTEIAIAQGEGGQSWVKLFEIDSTLIRSIKAFGAANAQGEVHLAAGDLENADGISEIIAGMGEGGTSRVKIFNYDGSVIRSFQAFDSTDNPGGEVRLAVGNFDADADLEIAASTGYNGGNLVRLFEKDGTPNGEFTAFGFGGNPNGDVQITASDIDNDGVDEIICAHGEGGVSQVKVFKANGTAILSFKAFGGVNAQGEVHLGKSNY